MEYAIISAELSTNTNEQNISHTESLKYILVKSGYGFIDVNGKYQGTTEKSLLIFNISIDYAIALGKLFKQESILTPYGLLYLEDLTLNPAKFSGFELVNDDDNYSEINGLRFRMPIDFSRRIQLQQVA